MTWFAFKKYLDSKGSKVAENLCDNIQRNPFRLSTRPSGIRCSADWNSTDGMDASYEALESGIRATRAYQMLDDEKLLKQQYDMVAGKWSKESQSSAHVLNRMAQSLISLYIS